MSEHFKNEKFDIFPLVFPVGENVEFCIRALAKRNSFAGEYTLKILRLDAGSPDEEFYKNNLKKIDLSTDSEGNLKFNFTADGECEYYVRIYKGEQRVEQLSIYAVDGELATRYPLRGDFHVHTTGSDGKEDPQIVCANYRRKGYDFIFITDHDKYFPSLDAISFYKDVKLGINILPGEEVHLPGTTVHIVNAGGLFSVNGLLPMKENYLETNGELSRRRFNEKVTPPDVYKMEDYWRNIATVEDYFSTNMDFLKPDIRKYFFKEYPDIYSKVDDLPPAKYNVGAKIKNSLVSSGSIINGVVEDSVVFKKVFVGNNCYIKNSIILNDVYIGDNCHIENCIVESGDTIKANSYHKGENGIKIVIEKDDRYVI